jgi:CARDB
MKLLGVVMVVAALAAASPVARASTTFGAVAVRSCGHAVAVFEGRLAPLAGAAKAQMRFTLQARTPDAPEWRSVAAPGWGSWITAPKGVRYVYDRRVERLLAPADYRATVEFRWRDADGRTLRHERATSRLCRQPDPRPDLSVTALHPELRYDATIRNSGRGDAGPFTVAFTRNGAPLGSVWVPGLAAGASYSAVLSGAPACAPGDVVTAEVDAEDVVDEVDEDGNVLSVTCS